MFQKAYSPLRNRLSLIVMVSLGLLAGCAHSEYGDAAYNMESREAVQKRACLTNQTPACISRIGQPTRCFCSQRDDLEDLLEPR